MIVDEMNKKSSKININFDFSSISGNTKSILKAMVVNELIISAQTQAIFFFGTITTRGGIRTKSI